MSPIRIIRHLARRARAKNQKRFLLRKGAPGEIRRERWPESLRNPTAFYGECFRYFHTLLPAELKKHREYFDTEQRSFGEDAFHVMWFLLFREFKPRQFLEIGVYRGQTLSLAALLQQKFGCPVDVTGISPFSSTGDSVSKYLNEIDYLQDTLAHFAHFNLPNPNLLKALSTDPNAQDLIQSRPWDCIYIDGNHDYEFAKQDWENCSRNLRTGGIIVLDDAGLTTCFRPPAFATGGHAGPSRVAAEIDRATFAEILQVGHNRVFQKIAK